MEGGDRKRTRSMEGGASQKAKRRCPRPESLRTGLTASTLTNGAGHQERGQVKNYRSQSDVPGEGEEIKSPKREKNRVESEETQDYVRDVMDLSQEEVEEISFVPSAISVLQKLMFRCDKQCSEKTLSVWQLASVVIQEGEESYTTNLRQHCYNKSLVARGDKPLTRWQWYEFVEKKAHRGRLWKMMGKEQYVR